MKKTVAVFFGGRSPEHDISIITALSAVIKPLKLSQQYQVVPVYVTKTGEWVSGPKLEDVSLYQDGSIKELIQKSKPVAAVFGEDFGLQIGKKTVTIDVAFPAMHGAYGEDGSLMGLLRMASIPFVGSDMDASVIAMDKVLAKQVAEANQIPTSRFVFFTRREITEALSSTVRAIQEKLTLPLYVKPAHLGSSIGIARVSSEQELQNALEVAAYYDEKIIVEEAVQNLIEVTVPIIGNDVLQPALVERPLSKDGEFFDFTTKYINGGGKKSGGQKGAQGYSELPADLSGNLYDQSIQVAEKVYRAIGASGIARIDLLIDSNTQTVYFNEVNPLPGSLYNHNWQAAGVSPVQLVEKLIEYAEERHNRQQSLQTTFDSNFLQQF